MNRALDPNRATPRPLPLSRPGAIPYGGPARVDRGADGGPR